MPPIKKTLKVCSKGHKFYKSSDCPTCPKCALEKKPKEGFLSTISAPARRALESKNISSLKKLSGYSEIEIENLHGMGPNAISKLQSALKKEGLTFKKEKTKKAIKKPIVKTKSESSTKPSETDKVDAFMKKLKHPLKNVIEELRKIILSTHRSVGEEIKWNAPTFLYTGQMENFDPKEYKRYIVVSNFYQKDCIRLIFPSGARVNDKSGLLEGDYSDGRRLAHFYSSEDVKLKQKKLQNVIKSWLKLST